MSFRGTAPSESLGYRFKKYGAGRELTPVRFFFCTLRISIGRCVDAEPLECLARLQVHPVVV